LLNPWYCIDGYDIYMVTEGMIATQIDAPDLMGEWPERES